MGTLLYSKATDQLEEIFLSPQESKGSNASMLLNGPTQKETRAGRELFLPLCLT